MNTTTNTTTNTATYTVSMWHENGWVEAKVSGYARAVGLFTSLMLSFDRIELREDGQLLTFFKDGKVVQR